ncbi:hypothetical protein [Pseudonocardia ailaonensis]
MSGVVASQRPGFVWRGVVGPDKLTDEQLVEAIRQARETRKITETVAANELHERGWYWEKIGVRNVESAHIWALLTLQQVDGIWADRQREWVDRLAAQQVVAQEAGHLVHMEAPHFVAEVVIEMLNAARLGQALAWR